MSGISPYVLLGEEPDGRNGYPPLKKPIPAEEHDHVLDECRRLIDSALCVSELDGADDVELANGAPIKPLSFENAIRSYRDKTPGKEDDRQTQRITPLDVLIHIGRIVDGLLLMMNPQYQSVSGGFPNNGQQVRERIKQLDASLANLANGGTV